MCQNCSKELAKTYDPKGIEGRLYKKWEDNGWIRNISMRKLTAARNRLPS